MGGKELKLRVHLSDRSYNIIVKRGSLQQASAHGDFNRKVLILSDVNVPKEYIQCLQAQCKQAHLFFVRGGEASKSVQDWQAVLSHMLELGFDRGDCVAAVGGGVVGDLGGFVAASYMRGIDFFQFPTTTLSQIDSSIGGKVAINLAGAKNVVGAFHQPKLVVIDPDTLETLDKRHWANGMAEALKTGLIGSSEVLQLMEEEDIEKCYEEILCLCLRYKKMIVECDETEQGDRKLLNFGHTIGHGIEAALQQHSKEEVLLHGECVALGMLPMITDASLRARVKTVMKKLHLPLSHMANTQEILPYIFSDKKRKGDVFTVVRVQKPGLGYLDTVSYDIICKMLGD